MEYSFGNEFKGGQLTLGLHPRGRIYDIIDTFECNIAPKDFNKIQKIRVDENWYSQAGWLTDSTQANLEMYNPIVMSKMFLLNDANLLDPFNSTHIVWIDGAITNTVHEGYFLHDNVLSYIEDFMDKFTFVCFPYNGKEEIHGFKYSGMCEYAGEEVDKVARGGIFGGPKHLMYELNTIYYGLLSETLSRGLMGTEESIFTIMTYKYPEFIQYYDIEGNGLLVTFFENLKNKTLKPKQGPNKIEIKVNAHNKRSVALYVLTYNSPKQFEKLCMSFEEYDDDFITKPSKFLLNNSLNHDTDEEYNRVCLKYGFEEIKKDNIGICGGRQFCAEHSEEHGFDYHMFFEDDMFFYLGKDDVCKNGFKRKIPQFFSKVMDIAWNENFDFLKFNFSEFFGDNTKQWAWHNVPAKVRSDLFPEKPIKIGNNNNDAPHMNFKNIKSFRGLPYAIGDIYYANWPQVVSREGNKKLFLNTIWAHPYEQTWMSQIFQDTMKGEIKPGILLATPTEHDRFEHYNREERREN